MSERLKSVRTALLGVSITSAVLGVIYLVAALQYPMGTPARPGAPFFTVFVGALWFLSCLAMGLRALSLKDTRVQIDWPHGAGAWRILQILGGCTVYIVIAFVAGHAIAATLVNLIVLQAIGGFRWYVNLGIAIAIGFGSYFFFDSLLQVPLPKGIWWS